MPPLKTNGRTRLSFPSVRQFCIKVGNKRNKSCIHSFEIEKKNRYEIQFTGKGASHGSKLPSALKLGLRLVLMGRSTARIHLNLPFGRPFGINDFWKLLPQEPILGSNYQFKASFKKGKSFHLVSFSPNSSPRCLLLRQTERTRRSIVRYLFVRAILIGLHWSRRRRRLGLSDLCLGPAKFYYLSLHRRTIHRAVARLKHHRRLLRGVRTPHASAALSLFSCLIIMGSMQTEINVHWQKCMIFSWETQLNGV